MTRSEKERRSQLLSLPRLDGPPCGCLCGLFRWKCRDSLSCHLRRFRRLLRWRHWRCWARLLRLGRRARAALGNTSRRSRRLWSLPCSLFALCFRGSSVVQSLDDRGKFSDLSVEHGIVLLQSLSMRRGPLGSRDLSNLCEFTHPLPAVKLAHRSGILTSVLSWRLIVATFPHANCSTAIDLDDLELGSDRIVDLMRLILQRASCPASFTLMRKPKLSATPRKKRLVGHVVARDASASR
mmetsp:Transcript_77527/g.207116  ORF Transcript_77527/g.207116 Transcript_77527/m.207116 type:complete len:239 (-) Transcript_77527:102-818(-)